MEEGIETLWGVGHVACNNEEVEASVLIKAISGDRRFPGGLWWGRRKCGCDQVEEHGCELG